MPPKVTAIVKKQFTYESIKQKMLTEADAAKKSNKADWNSVQFRNQFFRNIEGGYGQLYGADTFIGVWTGAKIKVLLDEINKAGGLQSYDRDIQLLIKDKIHEVRIVGWMIMRDSSRVAYRRWQSERATPEEKGEKLKFLENNASILLKHRHYIKNWDETDTVGRWVLGNYLCADKKSFPNVKARLDFLAPLAHPKAQLWSQRLAIVCTQGLFEEIKSDKEIYHFADQFIDHKHDLIHKAIGWMLREAAIRVSKPNLVQYLSKNATKMPRTMLRYSIEKFTPAEKKRFMKK
jgi:3-methyladenine DNA glycosylase AlkD